MAWPPTIPPDTRSNTTSSSNNHPNDHNNTSKALTELVNKATVIQADYVYLGPSDNNVTLPVAPSSSGFTKVLGFTDAFNVPADAEYGSFHGSMHGVRTTTGSAQQFLWRMELGAQDSDYFRIELQPPGSFGDYHPLNFRATAPSGGLKDLNFYAQNTAGSDQVDWPDENGHVVIGVVYWLV